MADAFAGAALRLGVAVDLLDTHRGPGGARRGPDAEALDDPAVRAAGLAQLAELTGTVAASGPHLAVRVTQAGLARRAVHRLVPDLARVRAAADRVHHECTTGRDRLAVLHSLRVARPGVRGGDPITELTDRLARLHRTAWTHPRRHDVGVGTLGDYAALGVLLHEHAARLLAQPAGDTVPDLAARREVARLRGGATAWRLVHLHLSALRTPAPASAGVRSDLLAVRDMLRRLTPPPTTGRPPDAEYRRQLTAVLGGVGAMTDIADWHARTLDQLAARGQLHLCARELTGDQVTDDPHLARAKLTRTLVPAPDERVRLVAQAYTAARTGTAVAGPSGRLPLPGTTAVMPTSADCGVQ